MSPEITAFATGTYTVTRAGGPGSYVDGVFVPASTSSTSVLAMVAPLDGRELLRLPEGLRSKELKQVFTIAALRVSAAEERPDVVSIDGDSWQVERVERWAELGNFYRSIVSKVTA